MNIVFQILGFAIKKELRPYCPSIVDVNKKSNKQTLIKSHTITHLFEYSIFIYL
jgi:hypothetical protein